MQNSRELNRPEWTTLIVTIDDGEIISRSLTQRAAFAALYDRHQRVVYRYAARRLGAAQAEDITSETFLVAFSRRADFAGGDDARPWLLGIATTLMHKHARQEARAWRGMLASDLARVDIDQFEAADSRLDATTVTRRMGKALARLPAGDRDALLLYTFGDLDYEGVAGALNIPIGTVRSRLNRARRKLRVAIDPASGRQDPASGQQDSASRQDDPATRQDEEVDHGRDLAPEPIPK